MRKSNLPNGCLYVLLTGLLLWMVFVEANPDKDTLYADFGQWLGQNLLGDRDVDEALTERQLALVRFQSAAKAVENALYADELELSEAVERILAAWREEFPDPAVVIAQFEPGETEQERVARVIIRQIEQNELLRGNQVLRERVQAQLADMLKKRPRTTPQTSMVVSMA